MINMPLIDASENLLDMQLMSDLHSNFTTRDGLILDLDGNAWFRWRTDGLDAWWRMFEETINAPMGRRLANSACDEEEWLLQSGVLDKTGFFRRKKATQALLSRWYLHGWGIPSLKPPSIEGVGLTPVFAGILQAGIERIESKRYRMRWEEKSPEACLLKLEGSPYPIAAVGGACETYPAGVPYDLEVESQWRIDGQKYHLIPAGLFHRLQESCAGLVANIGEDERSVWPPFDDGFLSIAIACKRLFIAGEEIFLAVGEDGWVESCEAYFAPMGLSTPISAKTIDSNGGVELEYSDLPMPSITVGFLAGAWTRSEGRPVKVSVQTNGKSKIISLQSRYEIA